MSTRENIRLIARAPLLHGLTSLPDAMQYDLSNKMLCSVTACASSQQAMYTHYYPFTKRQDDKRIIDICYG